MQTEKSDSLLAKVKLDDKKLLARKEALEHNKKLPASKQNKIAENIHKVVAKADKTAHDKKAAVKKIAESKEAKHSATEAKHPAKEAEKQHVEAKKADDKSGVKEALEVCAVNLYRAKCRHDILERFVYLCSASPCTHLGLLSEHGCCLAIWV
jgi:hypothetical protein